MIVPRIPQVNDMNLVCFLALAATAQVDTIQGKTPAQWIDTLKSHENVKYRKAALIVLEVYGAKTPGVASAVSTALREDADPQIRRESAMLLGRMGEDAKSAVPFLGDALQKDKSEAVREAAARALGGKLNPFAAEQVTTLATALGDPHEGTRTAAAEAILKLGEQAGPARPQLIALARDDSKDRFSRQYAMKCLARLASNDRDVANIFIATLNDKQAPLPLRIEAADGLARSTVAMDVVVPPLVDALLDSPVELQRVTAAALVKQAREASESWPRIAEGLKSSDQAVRYQLIRLAGRLAASTPAALGTLGDLARKDPHIENRLAAIQEMGQLGANLPAAAKAALQDLADNDISPAVRNAAGMALKSAREM